LNDAILGLEDEAVAWLVVGAAVELAVGPAVGLLEMGSLMGSALAFLLGIEDMMT
jgi:hypothetical protein